MKLSRLFQPRNPLFWLIVVLNTLSAALAWIVHHRTLGVWVTAAVSVFAIGNAVLGTWLVWRLSRDEPSPPKSS